MAAGMGSRYGSLKQMDGLGPGGETIMDYSVYDAIEAGFGKVVFVIRESFAADFKDVFSAERYKNKIKVAYVLQELDKLPAPFTPPKERTKPWGTNHAILMAKESIDTPFAVINADDYYGRDAFRVLANFLRETESASNTYAMVGYQLGKTLSESGAVSRGVCSTDEHGFLTGVVERTHIERTPAGIFYKEADGTTAELADKTTVSMNMWGFTPKYFHESELQFLDFLKKNGNELKAEYFIPTVVNTLVREKKAKVQMLHTDSQWFGVTYPGDRPMVVEKLHALIQQGVYPEKLWL